MSRSVQPPITVQILGFDGVQALDVVGPLEALAGVQVSGRPGYDVRLVGLHRRWFTSETGVAFEAQLDSRSNPPADVVIIPGGAGLRRPETLKAAGQWVSAQGVGAKRVVSICTGAYALAAAGLLDGRRATTHWRFAADLARQYPAIRLDTNAIFVKDGPFYTSAGVTAGIDLALSLAEEDFGSAAALDVAREMVVFLKRPGGQAQFSQPLLSQIRSAGRFCDLIAWMASHPDADQRLEVLAAKVSMTVRTFSRRFKDEVGRSPARFVEDLRLDASRSRLEAGHEPISGLAADLGFGSDDAFARAFARRFGIRPSDYRARFQTRTEP